MAGKTPAASLYEMTISDSWADARYYELVLVQRLQDAFIQQGMQVGKIYLLADHHYDNNAVDLAVKQKRLSEYLEKIRIGMKKALKE